jgi:hypothetical protein
VLISAVVFMAGFILMIGLLDTTLSRLSTMDMILARNIGEEILIVTEELADTTTLDSVVIRSNKRFRIRRQVTTTGDLAQVSVVVRREKRAKNLVHLYHEFLLPETPAETVR